MVDWTAGLLGGLKGGANAVDKLSEERRLELAEKLKREALEAIAERSDKRRHGYDTELQGTDLESREKVAGERNDTSREIAGERDATSREIAQTRQNNAYNIAGERNSLMLKIANMENTIREKRLSTDKNSNEAAVMNAQIKAYAEARKIGENGGTTDEMNAVLDAAKLPPLEDFEVTPEKPGILGFGGEPAVMGRRQVGAGNAPEGEAQKATPQTGLSPFLQDLVGLPGGETGIMSDEPGTAQAAESPLPEKDQVATPSSPEVPEPKTPGILQEQAPERTGTSDSPEEWDVTMIGGDLNIITPSGPVKMTPQQIKEWKQTEAGCRENASSGPMVGSCQPPLSAS